MDVFVSKNRVVQHLYGICSHSGVRCWITQDRVLWDRIGWGGVGWGGVGWGGVGQGVRQTKEAN